MQAPLIPIVGLVAGLYFLLRNWRLLRDEQALRSYITNSPKAARWVEKYGVNEAMRKAKTMTIPLGMVVSAALAGVSGYRLYQWLQWTLAQ